MVKYYANNDQIPIVLNAHTKPITLVKFNDEGDILFTSAKDNVIIAWKASNLQLIGSYVKHTAAIASFDVSCKQYYSNFQIIVNF